MSKLKKSPLVKVTYIYNDTVSNVLFDKNNKIAVLKSVISLSLNLNDFELDYGRLKSVRGDKTLKELLGEDSNPVFSIRIKKFENSHQINKSLEKYSENDGRNRDRYEDLVNISASLNKIATVKIENYPSLPEIYDFVKNFVKRKNLSKVSEVYHKGKSMFVSFTYPVSDIPLIFC